MDATRALAELAELSSQVVRTVVLDAKGSVLASTGADGDALAASALDLLAAAGELHSSADEVTRAEVELAEGGLFVLREGGRTIAATTGPNPTSGLVVYDLRTCLAGIDEEKPKRRRATRKAKEEEDA
ncbi:MAG: roadblock/LC7 domain-containing protein [Actinomycetota bacterium]|nr:roadblock/LC7 domain-containing protein [Actinomycetota bacterium]